MLHVSGKLNKHNVRIWGSEHPHEIRELERDSPKVNVWCGIMCYSTIDKPMLQQTWQEIEYHLDVLCVTKGAHIEMY